ncbi:MAG: hypothetical protein HC929_23980 [Leptolyngbyaceae cyanobacterium SM2_5_2]|nr:hypothetical protein [Leptolyngbyaceae cyanobacterium SM2_5_2]
MASFEYAALAVPEYWIVDLLKAKLTLLGWEEGWYEETVFTGNQAVSSPKRPEAQAKLRL